MKFLHYAKFWAALAGAIVTVVTVIWGDVIGAKAQQIVSVVIPIVTAMAVYAVPNATPNGDA